MISFRLEIWNFTIGIHHCRHPWGNWGDHHLLRASWRGPFQHHLQNSLCRNPLDSRSLKSGKNEDIKTNSLVLKTWRARLTEQIFYTQSFSAIQLPEMLNLSIFDQNFSLCNVWSARKSAWCGSRFSSPDWHLPVT
jgi:hypothetical protein